MKYLTAALVVALILIPTKGNAVNHPVSRILNVAAADDGPRLTGRVVATALTSPSAAVTYRAGGTMASVSGVQPSRPSARTTGPCSSWRYRHIVPALGVPEVQRRVKLLIRCAVDKWPVSLSTALYVANRESHYYCWAVNPSGSSGVYQIIGSTWDSWRAAFPWLSSVTVDNRLNCRSNVLTAIRAAYAYGWGAWSVRALHV